MSNWFLECYAGSRKTLHRIPLDKFPFSVGRSVNSSLTLDSPDVSRLHCEFTRDNNQIILQDRSSTNGVFVNHQQINEPYFIKHGDVIHFANVEYRVFFENFQEMEECDKTQVGIASLSSLMPTGLNEFQELLDKSQTTAVLQPIVNSSDHSVFAYEILGRGCHPLLPQGPFPLFQIAESTNKEVELSELFMTRGVQVAIQSHKNKPFFINTHPREMEDLARLLLTLRHLTELDNPPLLVLEIHEEAVTNTEVIRKLRKELQYLHIKLAYDDFGAGQNRLLQLTDAPPDFLKFDMAFIKDLEIASPMRIRMLEVLLKISRDSGITTLAEGVDSLAKATICRDLGFDLLQGFYFPNVAPPVC